MKLVRVLQSQGFGTRRVCVERIRAGDVCLDGQVCDDPDAECEPENLQFSIDGEVWRYREKAYVALHKPPGYECSHQPRHHPSVFTLLPPSMLARGVQCVGRLDQDTTGLLLLSDDGSFIHRVTSPKKHCDKVYVVTCKHPVDDALVMALREGVKLHDELLPSTALSCERTSQHGLKLTIAEGKYHQVKRMVAAAGNRVDALHRVAIGGYGLPQDLLPGTWRWMAGADLKQLEGR
ncbi:MAG: pseudouridine synthase [Thiobacillaceae bacterium]